MLSRRAHAVLHHDEKAWLADIDPKAPEFLSAQRTVFASLAQVDFASWRYELIGRDYDRPDLADTYDVPYHLPAVLLHYAIKGYDPGPVARPQALTFVLRGHRWRIASDSDADSRPAGDRPRRPVGPARDGRARGRARAGAGGCDGQGPAGRSGAGLGRRGHEGRPDVADRVAAEGRRGRRARPAAGGDLLPDRAAELGQGRGDRGPGLRHGARLDAGRRHDVRPAGERRRSAAG